MPCVGDDVPAWVAVIEIDAVRLGLVLHDRDRTELSHLDPTDHVPRLAGRLRPGEAGGLHHACAVEELRWILHRSYEYRPSGVIREHWPRSGVRMRAVRSTDH